MAVQKNSPLRLRRAPCRAKVGGKMLYWKAS